MKRTINSTSRAEISLKGIGAADGIAIGPIFVYFPLKFTFLDRVPGMVDQEMSLFIDARASATRELEFLKEGLDSCVDEGIAAIFDAHMTFVNDPALSDGVQGRLNTGMTAEKALIETIDEVAAMLEGMNNPLFAARGVDIRDVGRRILCNLLGVKDTSLESLSCPSIIAAYDLTPSDTVRLRPGMIVGFCTAAGGLTSHTSILARTLGIPAVVGIGQETLDLVQQADKLAINGATGDVVVNPTSDRISHFLSLLDANSKRHEMLKVQALEHAQTADGRRVDVSANIVDLDSAEEAVRRGAQGVGLLRTEFLYLGNTRPPSEDEQIQVYGSIFSVFGDRPVIVRTLDIGGDKPPSFLDFPTEQNPFLGWRGIRVCLDELGLFKTQLRAILRASANYHAMIMFPMISGVEELRRCKQVLEEVKTELRAEGKDFSEGIPVGIMVEVPAAVAVADLLAEECDFLSLGTNDLTQYALAVDRTNERVASLYQPLHPSILRLVKATIDAGHSKGKWVGMCGEMAGMKKAIPILLGLGLDEFSMAPLLISEVKWLMRQLTETRLKDITERALSFKTVREVDDYLGEILSEINNSAGQTNEA